MSDRPLTVDERQHIEALLEEWLRRCRVALSAYNSATTRTIAADRRLGVPAAILSAVVATAVFATVQEQPAIGWRIATGGLAIAAAVLTALQTFLRHQERAEQFRAAARSYGRVRRRIEQSMLFPPETVEEAAALMSEIADALDEAGRGKPNVSQPLWDRAEYKIKGRSDARGLRAWRIRTASRLDFGMRGDMQGPLVEDHVRYFAGLDQASIVPIARIAGASPRPASVATARQRMREAAAGLRDRRAPLDVREDGEGELIVLDGNATLAVAQQEGWTTVPVRVRHPS